MEKTLVTSSFDQTARIWNVETGKHLNTFIGHQKNLIAVAFSPKGGKTIATTSWDRTVRLWDTETAESIHILKGHTAGGGD